MSDVEQNVPVKTKGKAILPLRRRLKAWWDGEVLEVRRRGGQQAEPDGQQSDDAKTGIEVDRLTLLQDIWGKEQTQPGDQEFLFELIKPLGLTSGNTLVQFGGGMGLTARTAAAHFDCFVRALETDEELVAAGKKILFDESLDKKVELIAFDPLTYDYPAKSTDHLFAKEAFWPYKEKADLLAKSVAMVRPGGQFLLTDYMLGEGITGSDLGALAKGSSNHENLWTPAAYEEQLRKLKLNVRITEDVTERFQRLIETAWSDFAKPEKIERYGPKTGALLLDLAETWVGRSSAMAEGKIQIKRILAISQG